MTTLLHCLGFACLLSSCYGALLLPNRNEQRPLIDGGSSYSQDFHTQRSLKIQQNETICDAGSAQWTGHVPLGKGRNMFYCAPLTVFPTGVNILTYDGKGTLRVS